MSVIEIERALDELFDIEGVRACVLYRIDGVPITIRTMGFSENMFHVISWLQRQMRYVLRDMRGSMMDTITFSFKQHNIVLKPSSRSTVLVTVMGPEAHQQLISVEITRTVKNIQEIMT